MQQSLKKIQIKPTVYEGVHESIYRSYDILEKVLEMVERGDSKETIFEVVEFLREYPLETSSVTKPNLKSTL